MSVMNVMNEFNNPRVISGFGNTFICTSGVMDDKTINFPQGYENDEYIAFKVIFKNGHNCADDQTHMTLNSIPIVVNQYGTLIPLPIHEMDDSGTTKYKSLQSNTILEMYYTNDYDGNNNPAYVVIGNPIVLSSTDYTIYADGFDEQEYIRNQNILSDIENVTISTDINNPTIMDYDGVIISSGQNDVFYFYINSTPVAYIEWGNYSNVNQATTIFVKKDDRVCITKGNTYVTARWYKLRDYSGR